MARWLSLAGFGCLLLPMADKDISPKPALLTVKEAAVSLSLSIWTVYKLLDSGALRGVYQGRCRYVPADAIGEYVESLSATPRASA